MKNILTFILYICLFNQAQSQDSTFSYSGWLVYVDGNRFAALGQNIDVNFPLGYFVAVDSPIDIYTSIKNGVFWETCCAHDRYTSFNWRKLSNNNGITLPLSKYWRNKSKEEGPLLFPFYVEFLYKRDPDPCAFEDFSMKNIFYTTKNTKKATKYLKYSNVPTYSIVKIIRAEPLSISQEDISLYFKLDLKNYYKQLEHDTENQKMDSILIEKIIKDNINAFYQKQHDKNSIPPFTISSFAKNSLIFSPDKSAIFSIVTTELEGDQINKLYFVFLNDGKGSYIPHYWNYSYTSLDNNFDVLSSLSKCRVVRGFNSTEWRYAILNDSNFWSQYVLLQEDGKYKYLTKVE